MEGSTLTEYILIRSRRRTVCLQVRRDGDVVVRAPMNMAKRDIERFVQSHEAWIKKQQERMVKESAASPIFTFMDGDRLPFFGGELTLATGGKQITLQMERLLLPERTNREAAVTEFLREEARSAVTRLIARWSPVMEVMPAGIKITSARTRWGSCSGKDGLCFSFRVACLPPDLIEYIVVHELAHIREHNHSPSFWNTVACHLPDYKARQTALRGWQKKIPV